MARRVRARPIRSHPKHVSLSGIRVVPWLAGAYSVNALIGCDWLTCPWRVTTHRVRPTIVDEARGCLSGELHGSIVTLAHNSTGERNYSPGEHPEMGNLWEISYIIVIKSFRQNSTWDNEFEMQKWNDKMVVFQYKDEDQSQTIRLFFYFFL